MQIKTTMRLHLIPIRMAIIEKSQNIKFQQGCGWLGEGTLTNCCGTVTSATIMEGSLKTPQIFENRSVI